MKLPAMKSLRKVSSGIKSHFQNVKTRWTRTNFVFEKLLLTKADELKLDTTVRQLRDELHKLGYCEGAVHKRVLVNSKRNALYLTKMPVNDLDFFSTKLILLHNI